MSGRRRRWVVALTLVALLVRVATLDVQSYWSDEAATVALLQRSFGGMLRGVVDGESTPPLYYVLAWVWTQVVGTGEVGTRLLSALLSAGTVPVVAALAARVAVRAGGSESRAGRAAVAGAALAAVSPLAVWYGQEARAYALLMLLAAGSTLALLRALEDPSGRRLAVWAALAVGAMWTHHFAIFLVVAQAGWALWPLRARAVPAVGVVAAGAVALAPLLLHQRGAGRASFIAQTSLVTRIAQVPKQILAGYDGPVETLLTVAGTLAVLVAAVGLVAGLRGAGTAGRAEARRTAPAPGIETVATLAPAGATQGPADAAPPAAGTTPGAAGVPSGAAGELVSGRLGADSRPAVVVLVVTLAGVGLPLLAAAVGQDFLLTRNVLGTLPLVLALVAAGVVAVPVRAVGAAALLVLVGTGAALAVAVPADPRYQREDFRAAVRAATADPPAARVVVADAEGRGPVALYLGSRARWLAPGARATVREVDVVKLAGAAPGGARTTPSLPDGPPPPGFVLSGTPSGATWTVRRYTATAPVAVDVSTLGALSPSGATVVFARPR